MQKKTDFYKRLSLGLFLSLIAVVVIGFSCLDDIKTELRSEIDWLYKEEVSYLHHRINELEESSQMMGRAMNVNQSPEGQN